LGRSWSGLSGALVRTRWRDLLNPERVLGAAQDVEDAMATEARAGLLFPPGRGRFHFGAERDAAPGRDFSVWTLL
jgi:hypothetical protein